MAEQSPQKNLLEKAQDAERGVEALATALGQAGADDQTLSALEQISEALRQIVTALGAGQEDTADDEPAAQPRDFDEATDQMMSERQEA